MPTIRSYVYQFLYGPIDLHTNGAHSFTINLMLTYFTLNIGSMSIRFFPCDSYLCDWTPRKGWLNGKVINVYYVSLMLGIFHVQITNLLIH